MATSLVMEKTLLLLTSPPASGKTFWIDSFRQGLPEGQRILVISPLRALADECRSRWGDSVTVMTHEEWLIRPMSFELVIFDEFHLHFYWGDTFRFRMWDAFYGLATEASFCILLTATASPQMRAELGLFQCHFDHLLWVDFGNQRLRYRPYQYIKLPNKKWMEQAIENLPLPRAGSSLIFCQYRDEVLSWERKLRQSGFVVWSCVGGEAGRMGELLATGIIPDFIVATTVLSHGVNLPFISRIFFLYPVGNSDFWVQMVARGGRRGESYEVYSLERPIDLAWNRRTNFLAILRIGFKMRWQEYFKRIDQWFLKE